MKRIARLCAAACAVALSVALAQPTPPTAASASSPADTVDLQLSERLSYSLRAVLELPADLPIDAELRAAGQSMATSLIARMQPEFTRMLNGEWQLDVPMPPVVAAKALKREGKSLDTTDACARHQWWLAQMLTKEPAQRASALSAWRYATMPEATRWMATEDELQGRTPIEYPPFAARHGVVGRVAVEVTVDSRGRIAGMQIAERQLTVAGIRNVRPLAFETVLDAASMARVRAPDIASRLAPAGTAKETRIRVPISWTLQ